MFKNIDVWFQGYFWGTVLFPVEYYVVKRFGGSVWQDVKEFAYKMWDKVKAKV